MEVTTHDQPVACQGGSFTGYIITDPDTGAVAYKIGGGENGGMIEGALYLIAGLAGLGLLGIGVFVFGFSAFTALAVGSVAVVALTLGNLFKGLSLWVEAFGGKSNFSAGLCNLATYSYSTAIFAFLGLFKSFAKIMENIWISFGMGALPTVFLTPVCA